jgi:hypothetical protein
MSKSLATTTPEILEFIEELKPVRFMRTSAIMDKVREIAAIHTNGDLYPVMALFSYIITERRFSGKW